MIAIFINSSVASTVVMTICRLVFGILKLAWACYAVGEKQLDIRSSLKLFTDW